MTLTILLSVAGLVLIVIGGECLLRGATRLALALKLSPVLVGLTVVAFGTSAPEFAVSVRGAARGGDAAAMALGNVIGSNIFNVLFILGVSILIRPMMVTQVLVRIGIGVVVAFSALVWLLAANGMLGRLEGLLLVAGLCVWVGYVAREYAREPAEVSGQYARHYEHELGATGGWIMNTLSLLLGIGLLARGSSWLVDGAVSISTALGVSDLAFGMTLVAAATGMPEVATSIVAALRGEHDIAMSNIIGSNVFNLTGVLGSAALASSHGLPVASGAIAFDLPLMLVTAIACVPLALVGRRMSRIEGALLLACYIGFVSYLVMDSGGHDTKPPFNASLVWFAIPLTLVTVVHAVRHARLTRRA